MCSSQNPIHEKVKYSDLYETKTITVCYASDVVKMQVKLLAHKKWHSVMLEYFMKDKAMKEVVSEMDIITTYPTEEIVCVCV